MKIQKNDKGSTLLLTVIVIAFLTVLGTALLSMTTMNMSMKYSDKTVKSTHYYAESGIEQVYAIVAKKVDEIIISAQKIADGVLQVEKNKINEATQIIQNNYLDSNGKVDEGKLQAMANQAAGEGASQELKETIEKAKEALSIYKEYLDENLYIQTSILQNKVDKAYQDKFIIQWENDKESLNNLLNSHWSYVFEVDVGDIAVTGLTEKDPKMAIDKPVEMKVVSTYKKDGTQRTMSATVEVRCPNEHYPIEIQYQPIIENPIWQYALVAGGDISVNGNTQVQGNVYAEGKDTGISVGNNAGLTIVGDVVTGKDIKTNGVDARITMDRGNIFCENLIVEKSNSKDKARNDIKITNSYLYTKDDIELNGDASVIDISGKYIGFSDGVSGHDTSSSININATDVALLTEDEEVNRDKREHSSFRIRKEEALPPQGGYTEQAVGTETIKKNPSAENPFSAIRAIIPGTTWIIGDIRDQNGQKIKGGDGVTDRKNYQTGDSVTVKGNYITHGMTIEEVKDPQFVYINDLPMIDNIKGGENKGEYSYKAYNEVIKPIRENYPMFLTKGVEIEQSVNSKIYALGTYITNNTTKDEITTMKSLPEEYAQSLVAKEMARDIIENVARDYQYMKHYLCYRSSVGEVEADGSYAVCPDGKSCATPIDHYINLANTSDYRIDNNKVIYYNRTEKDVEIIDGKMMGREDRNLNNATGIIIIDGNLSISGSWNFKGTIIATGNITMEGKVNLVNDGKTRYELSKWINQADNFKFQNLFKHNSQDYMSSTEIVPGEGGYAAYTYSDLVKVRNWKQE